MYAFFFAELHPGEGQRGGVAAVPLRFVAGRVDHNNMFWSRCGHDLRSSLVKREAASDCQERKHSGGAQKDPQNQKVARTTPKNFPNNSRGLPGHYPVKQGL